jgi:cation diffusion facilitator CzcD-associated flavoprotein CzcO
MRYPGAVPGQAAELAVEVLVVGAGFSGIGAAIRLRQAGFEDLMVLEQAADLGGTWRDNTYPGCAVDVPSALYSYSFEPNPDWSRVFVRQPEIYDYLRVAADRYGVTPLIRFNTEVLRAEWDGGASRWRVRTTRGAFTAPFLVVSCGPWHQPFIPELPGLDGFPGMVMHTARWDQRVTLAGKRVAVVGTGASAVQVIPEIAPLAGELHVFQRTPQWVLPRPDVTVPAPVRGLLRRLPSVQRAVRFLQHAGQETLGHALRHPWLLCPVQALAWLNLRLAVRDRALRAALTPRYIIGCKRILTSSTYYKALARPGTRVHVGAVREICGQRVIGADGTATEVDVIILATGFEQAGFPVGAWLHDGQGRSLRDLWAGTPRAYLGSTVSWLPNLFLLLGPNLLTGHSSTVEVLERQLGYLAEALTVAREERWSSFEVRPAVEDGYNRGLQAALATTVYNTGGCASTYLTPGGHNSFCWPWSTARLSQRLSAFNADDYVITVNPDVIQSPHIHPREGINVH